MNKISIDSDLFHWSGEDTTKLLASQCSACKIIQFPQQRSCQACSSSDVKTIELERTGILWSWTSQEYPPNSPPYRITAENFKPFNLGYVELANQVRVQSKIIADQGKLKIGMPLELCFEPLFISEYNETIMMYAFKPKT